MSILVKAVVILFWVLSSISLWSWYLAAHNTGVGFLGLGTLTVGLFMLLSLIWDILEDLE